MYTRLAGKARGPLFFALTGFILIIAKDVDVHDVAFRFTQDGAYSLKRPTSFCEKVRPEAGHDMPCPYPSGPMALPSRKML